MQNLVITGKGQELTAKLIAGTSTATFTKIATSDYDYSSSTLETLTELYDVKQTVLVSKVSRTDTTIVEVLAKINNTELTDGYYVRALGLYAKGSDGVEILFGISIETNNPDYMPPQSGTTVSGISYRLNVKVDNSNQVTIEVNPAATPTMEQLEEVEQTINTHEKKGVYGSTGVHGFRYYNDELQVQDENGTWVDIESGGGGGISPSNVKDAKVKTGNQKLTLYWSDPGNTVVEGQTLCTWKGTKLVQKAGSYPESVKDGTLLLDNQVLDAYKTDGYEINGLTNGTTYYFALFPYADTGATNISEANRLSGTPQPYKKMTVTIDLSNSNPATCATYADDAVGMTAGSTDWDDFFGHYPVLFKDGAEVGKLNPDNFAQFIDGTAADITSGDGGDVMIAFPRRGLTISTSGTTLTVSMTDDPDNIDFEYNAHTRGTTAKDVFYLGVYKGYTASNKLRSLSGKTPTANQTIGTFRTQAQANGAGYEQSGFYQLIFRQCMYLLKYKNLNSQATVGYGYVLSSHNAAIATGGTESWGMDCEIIRESNPSYMTDQNHHVKLFGLEDFWGNIWEWIDGCITNSTRNILTGNDNFNNDGTGYVDNGQGATANIGNYMSKPQGTTKTGFLAKEVNGSDSTYFCDSASLYASCVAIFGGHWANASYAGAFQLYVYYAASFSSANIAARLMYL